MSETDEPARPLSPTSVTEGSAVPAPVEPREGDRIGRYRLLRRLGAGGMGVVFAAHDPKLQREVALELIRPGADGTSGTRAPARLLREAQAIAQLSHPNVVAVFDVGTFDGQVYLATELVEGRTLTAWLRGATHPWRDGLDLHLTAGRGLAAAHAAGLADVVDVARVRLNLARALLDSGRDPTRGRRLAEESRAVVVAHPRAAARERAEVEALLRAHRSK